jgi:hypothetical protein
MTPTDLHRRYRPHIADQIALLICTVMAIAIVVAAFFQAGLSAYDVLVAVLGASE